MSSMLSYLVGLILLLGYAPSWGAEIPRPILVQSEDPTSMESQISYELRSFELALELKGFLPQIFVFQKALAQCKTDVQRLHYEMSRLLSPQESLAFSAIKHFYPDLTRPKIAHALTHLRILIDNFGENSTRSRSFYLPVQTNLPATIVLDCQMESRQAWDGILAHELTHHLNAGRNLAPWIDEMLAQRVEAETSGWFASARIRTLESAALVPSFFARGKTFQNSKQYAVNILFESYIEQTLGGISSIQSFTKNAQHLEDLAKGIHRESVGKPQFDYIRDFINSRGLIVNFALALNISQPILNHGTLYQVPHWFGFSPSALAEKNHEYTIEPGGFLRLDATALGSLSLRGKSSFEIYRILKKSYEFKIQKADESINGNWPENFLILINTCCLS